jgi:hypothetical protein
MDVPLFQMTHDRQPFIETVKRLEGESASPFLRAPLDQASPISFWQKKAGIQTILRVSL